MFFGQEGVDWKRSIEFRKNKRNGKQLAISTIRRELVKKLKAVGYKIHRTGDINIITASGPLPK